jgi:azurin
MTRTLRDLGLYASIALAGALGCGGDKSEPAPAPADPAPATADPAPAAPAAQPAAPAAPAPGAPTATLTPDAEGVVRLTGNDQMRYNAARIEAKAGQKIKVELKNVGSLPKEAMGHNFVVLKVGMDPMAFAMKGVAAKDTEYIAPDAAGDVIAKTKILGPGESETVEFEVPGPGTYPFVCTFPGHAALMNGQLVVSE